MFVGKSHNRQHGALSRSVLSSESLLYTFYSRPSLVHGRDMGQTLNVVIPLNLDRGSGTAEILWKIFRITTRRIGDLHTWVEYIINQSGHSIASGRTPPAYLLGIRQAPNHDIQLENQKNDLLGDHRVTVTEHARYSTECSL